MIITISIKAIYHLLRSQQYYFYSYVTNDDDDDEVNDNVCNIMTAMWTVIVIITRSHGSVRVL